MAHIHSADKWDKHSSKWASSVQNLTRKPCEALLQLATSILPISSSSRILDNGAGSGMFTNIILTQYPSATILAADLSPAMLNSLTQNIHGPNLQTVVADAMDLQAAGLEDQSFTHAMGTFFLNFVPDPIKAISEMQRVTKSGGIVAIATWSRVDYVPIWQKAVRETVDEKWIPPAFFHPQSTELEDVKGIFQGLEMRDVQAQSFACRHAQKESPEAAVDEFLNLGNPTTMLLMEGFSEEQIQMIRPAFVKAYREEHDGVEKAHEDLAVFVVGTVV